jgi:two-component system sensor histidine kinase/response regulator
MKDKQQEIGRKKIRVHFWDQMVLIGIGLALFYTVFDSVLYIFLSYDVNFFHRLFGPDISEIWSRITIVCLFIIFGSHAQYTINKRALAESALSESEEKFRTIIETAPDGYYEVDLRGNFTFFNDSICTIFGYSRHEIATMNQRGLLDETNAQILTDTFKKVVETREPVKSLAWTLINKDGSRRFVESSVSLINDPKGNPTGFGGFIRDVTQRHRAEALYRAKMAAEAASRTKSEFLASMSHEIRTPLNSIIGLVELMLSSKLSPDQREDLDVVKSSAYSLLSIINNILDFSKIEAGKLEFEQTPFSLNHFMDESLKIMGMKSHEKGLELFYRISPDVPDRLLGDPLRLRQVLLNLVDNAIKFTEKGEVAVFVAVKSLTEYEVYLHFSVVDTGIGIPKEKHRSIFGAYNQGSSETMRRYGGTGLGLAVSAQLVDLMGGRIKVKSQPGKGSRFRFTTRVIRQKNGDSQPREIAQQTAADTKLAGLRVLVVDDNASNRKVLREILEHRRMVAVLADSAAEAKEILLKMQAEKAPFDIIVLDSKMPETDGFGLAEWIVQQKISNAGIIMMLTFPDLKRNPELEKLGITASVVKPLGAFELEGAILSALGADRIEPDLRVKAPQLQIRIPARPLKILVAEDTPFNQKFILRLLERWNHRTTLVENGRQALEVLKTEPCDLILMDVQMPEMDGLQATRIIRENEQQSGNHIPIIAMTAHAVKGDRERCLQAGMDEYVSKPIDSNKLFEAIEMLARKTGEPDGTTVDSATLDEELLLQAFDGDWDFLKEVVEVFLSDYPRLVDDLRRALKEGDSDLLMRSAHSLKGMLKNFQAEDAAEIALELEGMGKVQKYNGVQAGIEKLADQISQLDNMLRRIVAQRPD